MLTGQTLRGRYHRVVSDDSERAAEIMRRAADPDRRLPGEDPDRSDANDARHWVHVYDELLHFKHEAIDMAEKTARELPQPADVEIGMDVEVMRIQAQRLHNRAAYWRNRLEDAGFSP
jgi:hypothetical protein